MRTVFVGTSGWVYAGWRKHLYGDVPVRRWLEVASRTFDALEINGSFYTQIKPETYQRWRAETPDDFRFALKAASRTCGGGPRTSSAGPMRGARRTSTSTMTPKVTR